MAVPWFPGIVSSLLNDNVLLPDMRGTDLGIPPAIQNETAVVTFLNLDPEEPVTAKIVPVGEAKGHVAIDGFHDEEVRIAEHLGSLTNHQVSVSGECEIHTWTLIPSAFSGNYEVEITVAGASVDAPFTVKVPGLVPIQEGERIHLYQSDDDHAGGSTHRKKHPGFYYLTPGFKGVLEAIADEYRAIYPDRPLWVNDASLEWGGRFDYPGHWGDPHKGHRRGLEADIATFKQYPLGGAEQAARIEELKAIITNMPGVKIVIEPGVTNHIHIRAE